MRIDIKASNSHLIADEFIRSEIEKFSAQKNDFWSSVNRDPREYAHSLFQYPAMMVPAVQKQVIDLVLKAKPKISAMVDPYIGAGTTFTAAMSCGLSCFGQDINPLSILVSKAKTDLGWSDHELLRAINRTVTTARTDESNEIAVVFPNMEKWFKSDVSIALSKIRRAIQHEEDIRIRRLLWVILAETIRLTSNDRTTTYKLHARPIEEIEYRCLSPIDIFEVLAAQSADDMIKFKHSLSQAGYIRGNHYINSIKLALGSTTDTMPTNHNIGLNLFELLVTSPPYGDNTSTITYGQHSYLPLQWIALDDIDPMANESFLRTTQEIDRRSLGGHTPRKLQKYIEILEKESESLAEVFTSFQKTKQPKDRSARVASFYNDFIKALDCILLSLADNSYMVWTVGNRSVGGMEIPNDQILIELLAARSSFLVSDINRNIHFKRMPHKNKFTQTMSAEKIMIFRKQPIGCVTNE